MHISGRVIKLQMLLALFITGCGAPGGPPDKASGVIRLVPDVSCSDWTKSRMTLLEYGPGGGCSLSQSAYIGNAFEFSIPDNGMENPVYYVKYAHARICTMLENLRRDGYEVPAFEAIQPEVLRMPEERSLIKKLAEFPDEIASAAQDLDTSRLNRYAKELAGDFHKFYTDCRVKGAEESLLLARLYLSDATRQVLASSLRMIGIKAPQKM